MQVPRLAIIVVLFGACYRPPAVHGPARHEPPPAPPMFQGKYDFDLLESVRGKACVKRTAQRRIYWSGSFAFANAPTDALTLNAISEASIAALDEIPEADTILVTRLVTEAKPGDEACAWVYGRAVRIRKAGEDEGDHVEELEPPGEAEATWTTPPAPSGASEVFDLPRPRRDRP